MPKTVLDYTSTLGVSRNRRGLATGPATDSEWKKANGIHYTPFKPAKYLAEQVAIALKATHAKADRISILDPACGEGELLKAIVDAVPQTWRAHLHLAGFDMDEAALFRARNLLKDSGVASLELRSGDFLSQVASINASSQMDFLQPRVQEQRLRFDAVISNPPYVRTQVLGSASVRELAVRFDLTGRLDLYHAFVKAMTLVLREGGILGLLTSNRFLTVQSGASMRDWLTSRFRLRRLVDLGDTKLFEAAVLPAIVVAERANSVGPQDCEFIRVYESPETDAGDAKEERSILDVLDGFFSGNARTGRTCFHIETGKLQIEADSRTPWAMRVSVSMRGWHGSRPTRRARLPMSRKSVSASRPLQIRCLSVMTGKRCRNQNVQRMNFSTRW